MTLWYRRVLLLCLATVGLLGQTLYEFSEPGRRSRYELSATEVYVNAAISPERLTRFSGIARVQPIGSSGVIVAGSTGRPALVAGIHTPPATTVAPVFYDRSELPSADRLARLSPESRDRRIASARRILTSRLLVKLSTEDQWQALAAAGATGRENSVVEGWSLVSYADPQAALKAIDWLDRDGGWEFVPVFARKHYPKQAAATLKREVNDTLFEKQWHLAASGANLRMGAAWDSVTGKGINIAVVDDGVWVGHEDLKANAWPLEGNYHRNFNEGEPNDPTPTKAEDNHGTNCAGLAAAVGFNNLGVIGVAPEARLMGVRLIAGPADDEQTAQALLWQPEGVTTHVSSNSWGPEDDGKAPGRSGALQAAALQKGATEGRDGLGIVYVISAGNGRDEGDDSSYDEFSSSRFAIAVGAVNRDGEQSSYSESGMNVAVSALGGEFNPPSVMWTTNNMGEEAVALLKKKFETSTAPVNYSDAFNGTSAAAPQVSGAVALMLERNPKLGYRDVKEILMRTAHREGLKGEDFRTNGGGLTFSHSFGAGLLNVAAALEMAADWKNLGPVISASHTVEDPRLIPDGDEGGVTYQLDFSGAEPMRVEHVEMVVDAEHPLRGDVGFLIISPSGMISIAQPRPQDEGEDFEAYKFTSVRHWGETSTGAWRVRAIDTDDNDAVGGVLKVTLRLFGTAK